jgi:hypothetical protein
MVPMNLKEQAEREYVVAQALANVRARGFAPGPEVTALYARYARGELSRAEVQAEMSRRSERIGAGRAEGPRP